tara:strand:- start:3061 stop:4302 length:1242 start_codon:yes stop_codon:yes gene_type:complete
MLSNFPSLFIAFRYLKPSKKNTMVSIISIFSFLGIVLGVGTLIIVMSVMNGFKIELLDKIIGINGHINIYLNSNDRDEDFLEILNKENNIKSFRKIIDGQALLSVKNQSTGIILKGINKDDLINFKKNKKNFTVSENFSFDESSVIIGLKLKERMNLQNGEKIKLIIPKSSSTPFGNIPRTKTFIIGGFFDSGMYTYDNNLMFINFNDANKLFLSEKNKPYFQIEFFDINSIDNFKNKLNLNEKINNYQLYDWRYSNEAFFNAIQTEKNVMFLILSLIILVAAFNIISSLIMLVKNKQVDIAILRTMGASKNVILKIFFLNGAIIGFFGTLIGTFLGIFFVININSLKNFLEKFTNTDLFSSEIYFLSNLPARIDFNEVFYVVITSILISFLASFVPAWKASKSNPIELIRKE